MTFVRFTKALVGFAFFAVATFTHALNLTDPIPVGPQVTKGQLSNGLTYYVQRNTKPAMKTELRLVVKAGSAMEDDDQKGLAHLLEHMAFNGSTNFKKHELVSYLQSMGLKFGADLNAYTSFNETVYILPIPSINPKDIAVGMKVLEDWAHGLTLNTADIDAERAIVIEELRLRKGVQDRMQQKLIPKLLQGSKYAERLPIGNEHDLRTFNPDAVRRFYKDWYRPDLMAVVAVGDFDAGAMEALIKKHFEPLKNPTPARPLPTLSIPARTQMDTLVLTDSENPSEAVQAVYSVLPSADSVRLVDYRNDTVEALFNAMLGHRLALTVEQAKPPFILGSAQFQKSMPGYKSFSMSASLNREGLQSAMTTLIRETQRARQYGFTSVELDRAKKNYWRSLQSAYAEKDKTPSHVYAQEYIRNFLVGESIPGIVEELRLNKELLPSITVQELNAFAQKILPTNASPALLVYMGSPASNVPTEQELRAAQAAAFAMPVDAGTPDTAQDAPLLAALPTPGTVVATKHFPSLNTMEYTLSNGIRVLVKPTAFKQDQILLSGSRFGGQSRYDVPDMHNARHAVDIASSMGLGPHSPTQLSNLLAGKAAQLSVGMDMYRENVAGSSTISDAQTLFELMHLRFSPMRRDQDLFSAYISRAQDATKNARVAPETMFSDALSKAIWQNHPRTQLAPSPDDFAGISLDRVEAIYNERFGSAKGFDFILVGNIDPEKLQQWLTQYFATLPTKDIGDTYRDLGVRSPTKSIDLEIKKGREPKSVVTMSFGGPTSVSDVEQVRLQLLLEVLNLRIMEVLREQKTLIYSGGIGGSLAYAPYEQFGVRAVLPSSPENVPAVIQAMEDEIRTIQANGPTASDMAKVVKNWLAVQGKQEEDNEYWLAQLQTRRVLNKSLESMLQWHALVLNTTALDIQQAAKTYLPLNQYIKAVLSPAETSLAGK